MAIRDRALAVLAKAPTPGAVKTRLVPPLTPEQAADLCRALLVDQLAHLRTVADAALYLFFAPAAAKEQMKSLAPAGYRLIPQQGADLGARMLAVFDTLYGAGHKRIVLIGGDLAPLPEQFLAETFAFLEAPRARVALGPSQDGGYYLIGANRPMAQLFDRMTWSHGEVLAETRRRLRALHMRYRLLPEWFDVDRPDDVARLQAYCEAERGSAMSHVTAWFDRQRNPSGAASILSAPRRATRSARIR